MLGICNGFQILTEARLLPGALRQNESLSFVCRDVALRVERDRQPVHRRAAPRASALTIPVKHGEGCWFADAGDRSRSSTRPARSSCATRRARTRTAPSRDVAGVVQRGRATCSGSCRIRSMRSIRCSARPTARSSSARSSTPLDCRPRRSSRRHLRQPSASASAGLLRERRAQPLEVARPQRDRAAPRRHRRSCRRTGRAARRAPTRAAGRGREALARPRAARTRPPRRPRRAPGVVAFCRLLPAGFCRAIYRPT